MIKINNLTVAYEQKMVVIDNLNLHIAKGEKVALIGPNGAGKTSLFLAMVGILPMRSGSIYLHDLPVSPGNMQKIRAETAMLFQNPDDQLFTAKVYDDLAFGLRNAGMTEDEIAGKVNDVLQQFKIETLRERIPHRLSGGEKRSVALAALYVLNPQIFLLDEPTSFLDPQARRIFMEQIISLEQTFLIATHDLDMVLDLCDKVVILNHGQIAAMGWTKDILYNQSLLEANGLELPLSLSRR